jgi:ESS family glutamate:Na+ symporter
MNEIRIEDSDIIILAILVLWLGNLITGKVVSLQKYSIPIAVTGGLICSVVALIGAVGSPGFVFDLQLGDLLLLVFFSTIGISANFARLKSGGRALGILVLCAAIFLVLQNVTGVLLAMAFGGHPGMGLFAGSISLAGGILTRWARSPCSCFWPSI